MASNRFCRHKRHYCSNAKKTHAAGTGDQAYCFALLGLDPEQSYNLGSEDRKRLLRRIDRMISRERQKGIGGHWSYDLNRHIALKQLRQWMSAGQSGTTD